MKNSVATVSTLPRRGSSWLTQFCDRTVDFVCESLRAEWGCFYLLDADTDPFAFHPRGVPTEFRLAYIEHGMDRSDPLHPRRLAARDHRFTLIDDPRLEISTQERRQFWRFLHSFGARHAAEMVFWHQQRPVAGLSLIWRKKSARAIASQWTVVPARDAARPGFGLTRRERDVAQLACCGCTNAEIARRLNIGLATVKTHLINIFGKTGVPNRAALVNRLLTESYTGPARSA
jgi:DNA-binding CsgD family transcriptional regulator